jgi:soluble lytic murein transglycosylase-like protein
VTIPSTYDAVIQIAALRYLPAEDWRWLKAQWWTESRLDPKAKSPAGALGLCQIMPETFAEVAEKLEFPRDASVFDPNFATLAGTFYMAEMWRQWHPNGRSLDDRRKLAQAAYNAGLGSILRAQHLADGAMDYDTIIAQLHRVTGESNAHETKGYVIGIAAAYHTLNQDDLRAQAQRA